MPIQPCSDDAHHSVIRIRRPRPMGPVSAGASSRMGSVSRLANTASASMGREPRSPRRGATVATLRPDSERTVRTEQRHSADTTEGSDLDVARGVAVAGVIGAILWCAFSGIALWWWA